MLSKSFDLLIASRLWPLEHVFDVRSQLADGFFAVIDLNEGQDQNHQLKDKDEHTDKDSKIAKSGLFVIVASPSNCPVDDPDQIHQQRNRHQVPDSCLLLHVSVVPQQNYEREQRKVVVWPLEVGEQTQDDNCHEQFVNVLNHSI